MRRDQCKVQVWNDCSFPWKETFKGDPLEIPAGKCIEMGFYEAHEFKGQMCPLFDSGDGGISEKSQKKIRVVEHEWQKLQNQPQEEEPEKYQCNLCKEDFDSTESLVKHSVKNHADRIVKDDEAEEAIPKKKKKTA